MLNSILKQSLEDFFKYKKEDKNKESNKNHSKNNIFMFENYHKQISFSEMEIKFKLSYGKCQTAF